MNKTWEVSKGLPCEDTLRRWARDEVHVVLLEVEQAIDVIPFLVAVERHPGITVEGAGCPPIKPLQDKLRTSFRVFDGQMAEVRRPKNYARGSAAASKAFRLQSEEKILKMKPLMEEAEEKAGNHNTRICEWLNENGHKNMQGNPWNVHNVQYLRARIRDIEDRQTEETD